MLLSTKKTKKNAIFGIFLARPLVSLDVARVEAVVDHTNHEEHRASFRPWLIAMEHGVSCMPYVLSAVAPQRRRSPVRHGGIRDQLLDVLRCTHATSAP